MEKYGGASTAADASAPEAAEPEEETDSPQLSPASAPLRDYLFVDDEPDAPPDSAVFVHFIPPPLRENGKRDLPWIVHTCDGSGCREAKHVTFHSICGFSTFEGSPPEQADGTACDCAIANHHLRGFGRVRWERGDLAFIEHHAKPPLVCEPAVEDGDGDGSAEGDVVVVEGEESQQEDGEEKEKSATQLMERSASEVALLNMRAVREDARKQSLQLSKAREEIHRLRATTQSQADQLCAVAAEKMAGETGAVKELSQLKRKKKDLDERHRLLALRFEQLTAKNKELEATVERLPKRPEEIKAAAAAAAAAERAVEEEAERRRAAAMAAAAAAAAAEEEAAKKTKEAAGQAPLAFDFSVFNCVLVCLPKAQAADGPRRR